jgi:hypothetical protein
MPQNGEINERFGVYRSICCDYEIVIGERVTFPDCPHHIKLTTQWKQVVDDRIRHVTEISDSKIEDSAA